MEVSIIFGLPVILLLGSAGGWLVRQRLGEHHRSRDTVDALRVVMSMMVTFAALVLGLLTSSAKSDFDVQVRSLQTFGIGLIELNQRLREYGPAADPARATLRRYTAAAIASTWPYETPPGGDYPRIVGDPPASRIESAALGAMLLQVDEQLAALSPTTSLQRQLTAVLEQDLTNVLTRRWQLVAGAATGIAWPFLAVLLLWLTLAFFTFGLSTPATWLTVTVIGMAAVSVSAAVYLIVDFGSPLSGLLHLTSTPLRDALSHMDRIPVAP